MSKYKVRVASLNFPEKFHIFERSRGFLRTLHELLNSLLQEVTLERTNTEEKVGLTLCYGSADDEITDIFISEVRQSSFQIFQTFFMVPASSGEVGGRGEIGYNIVLGTGTSEYSKSYY